MTTPARRGSNRLRIALWTFAFSLLLIPLVAMRFTDEVKWSPGDFLFAIVMIGGTGLVYELAARASGSAAYRAGVAVALAASFLLVWINGAVGIIGDEGNPANLLFFGVIAVAFCGACVAGFRPRGMAVAMSAAALAQALVALAVALGLGAPRDAILTIAFLLFWLTSAWLFRNAVP